MTYRGLPADYDAWKTRSDRDDDSWNEPEPEMEECMAEPADIAALVERLRGSIHDAAWEKHALVQEAADALEALQAEMNRLLAIAFDAETEVARLRKQYVKAEAEIERLREALEQIDRWGTAYPLDVFPEPDFKKARALLEAGGIKLDAVSASNMRHVVDGVAKIARTALHERNPT